MKFLNFYIFEFTKFIFMAVTIPQKALTFFKDLEKNNNRDWFNKHKPEFKQLETEVKRFYNALLDKLQKHDDVDTLKMFRIYSDVRFSKDKSPYKTHFGGSFSRKKPHLRGGYYLHISPSDSFIATGFWQPNKEDLFRIRKEFEIDDSEVTIRKEGDKLIIEPIKKIGLLATLKTLEPLNEDFPDIDIGLLPIDDVDI